MLYKGNNVEVIVDVLPNETLSAQNLLVYRRSSYLKLIMSAKNGFSPYMSLKDVEPKPLWKFPGHPAIKDEWFSKLLVFDGGQHDLIIDSDAVRQAIHPHPNDELIKIIAGEFVIPAATQIVVGEAGIVWSMDPKQTISESLAEWKFVVDLKLRKVADALTICVKRSRRVSIRRVLLPTLDLARRLGGSLDSS